MTEMTATRVLPLIENAPVLEAGIGVNFPTPVENVYRLADWRSPFDGRPPAREQIAAGLPATHLGGDVPDPIGFKFSSADRRQHVSMYADALILTQSAPYKGWDALLSDFLAVFESARGFYPTGPGIARVVYRNAIPMPQRIDDLRKWFPELPNIPHISGEPGSFLFEHQSHTRGLYRDRGVECEVQQSLGPLPELSGMFYSLTIGAGKPIDAEHCDSSLREVLALCRETKNAIFKACIGPDAMSYIEEGNARHARA